MKEISVALGILLAGYGGFLRAQESLAPARIAELMPRTGDESVMWWRDGFPSVVEGAPWHRCIAGDRFGFVLDTENLAVPHFGPLSGGRSIESLPAAVLKLQVTIDGVSYHCLRGGKWARHGGPRLIESGRFFQRADVTDLEFVSETGERLIADARITTAAWSDRLALSLALRPGVLPIVPGEGSFGRAGGGFGLDGSNHFEIPADGEPMSPSFTLEFQVFVPADFRAGKHSPWLVCKNRNELADGNFGVMVERNGTPVLRFNPGGGKENARTVRPESGGGNQLEIDRWNHLAIVGDGESMRLHRNGRVVSEAALPGPWRAVPGGISFGRRHDNSGDGYRFRGVIDEIRFHDRALSEEELQVRHRNPKHDARSAPGPVASWGFREDGKASELRPRARWKRARTAVEFVGGGKQLEAVDTFDLTGKESGLEWREATLAFDPVAMRLLEGEGETVRVTASDSASGRELPVVFEKEPGWFRVDLDGIVPTPPPGEKNPSNDAIERVRLGLRNDGDRERVARLVFSKSARGFRQRIGSPITGMSVILRDANGNPAGIPVQLSKNWHRDPLEAVHDGTWFHGITRLRLPPKTDTELELVIAYGHWGGLPAASHAQLSLIGWGSNQLWEESALGSWGESICYEPEQVQRGNTIMDVRPLLVTPMGGGSERWGWTNNVGGGDVLRFFDSGGHRQPHRAMKSRIRRHGPCLTEATYSGRIGSGIDHRTTVSLARGDDLVRGFYRIRMDVREAVDFSRLVIFQIGADTYNSTRERELAIGDETGLHREWAAAWGGNIYRTERFEMTGAIPWVSLHEAESLSPGKTGALANRGFVIRDWKARLGGEPANPWVAERGLDFGGHSSSTIDLLPPPGVTRLLPGDFVEATIEHIVMPQFAADYYGWNEALRDALEKEENTWRMILREAIGNDRRVDLREGELERRFPDLRIATSEERAEGLLEKGLGQVAITFTGLSSHSGHRLLIDGEPLDQGVHGNDFWQTDYDPETKTWSRTYNIPSAREHQTFRFEPVP